MAEFDPIQEAQRRRMRYAEALMMQGMSGEPIQHWAQGLARLGQAGIGGWLGHKDEEEAKAEKDRQSQLIAKLLGPDSDAVSPGVSPAASPPAQPPMQGSPAAPPMAPPVSPPMRAPVAPPQSDAATADRVAGMLDSAKRGPQFIQNGTIPPHATFDRPTDKVVPAAPPPAAPPPNAAPPAAPGAPDVSRGTDATTAIRRRAAAMVASGIPAMKALGMQLFVQSMKPDEWEFKVAGDQIFRTNKRTGKVEPVEGVSKPPQFVEIGTDPTTGAKKYGFVDPKTQRVVPYDMPGGAPPQRREGDPVIPPVPAGGDPKKWREKWTELAATAPSALRKEIQDLPSYKSVVNAVPVYKSMVDAASRDTRAADVNLIYGMAKIMDPGSVVRESEMTVAQAVATLPQSLQARVKSQIAGSGRLSPDVRAAIMQEAYSRMSAYRSVFDRDAEQFRGIVKRRGFDPRDVLPNFDEIKPYEGKASSDPAKGGTSKSGWKYQRVP